MMLGPILTIFGALIITITITLGAHVYGWELVLWAWIAVTYSVLYARSSDV
jgi:hypothetical protein